ncbi:uncharacterized protein LOC124365395 [Homalodisca vitripennis]|uniref:uncharacterized protein LOC124365395 n=1 Tax=Homalodisca vitripennis TaxID=197043 RepID=UPI001EEB970B|nr:uncharacterized protein LOC124365395 [Homalodisca vitripennis]
MSDLVESMLQTLKVQRNVNSGIKEGLPKLTDQLQQMMDLNLRRLNQRTGTSEKKLPGRKRARRASCPSPEEKSPSDQRPTISTMERATQVSPRGLTRPQDASERELPPDSMPSECFRCLGYGHSSRNCKGPDRSKNCLRCGGNDHKRKDCDKSCCFLCKDKGLGGNSLGHIPGSGKCSIVKAALEEVKKKVS